MKEPKKLLNEDGGDLLETIKEKGKIIGKSTAIEKPYYRLLSMPHESEIRPEPILRKCLGHVRQMREEGKAEGAVLEQFRSIRQVWSLSAFRGPKERVYSQKTGLDGSGHPERVLPRGLRGQHAVLFGD